MATKRFELYHNLCTIDTCRTAFSRFSVLAITAVILNAILLLMLPAQFVAMTAILCIALAGLLTVRLEHALYVAFFYFTFAGMIKVLSNYNPILHVSADLFLVLFLLRSLSDNETMGFTKVYLTPAYALIAVFLFWVFAQFFNPLGLGLLPSLAGLKIYVIPMILMLLACHHMNDTAAERFTQVIVGFGCLMATATVIEYLFFQNVLTSLHPAYERAARGSVFSGAFYRPFGFTEIPGKPSVFISMTAPFATYQLFSRHPLSTRRMKMMCLYFLFMAIPVLIFCQTRVAMLQTFLGIFLVLLYDPRRALGRVFTATAFLAVGAAVLIFVVAPSISKRSQISNAQLDVIGRRVGTLATSNTYTETRPGFVSGFNRLMEEHGLVGLGLSRTGASAGVWSNRINNHPFVRKSFVFADNVYVAILTETGIVGLISWIAMVGSIMIIILKNAVKGVRRGKFKPRGFLAWTCFVVGVVVLISGYGSEGVLYYPVAAFMWTAFGLGVRKVSHAS